MSVFILNGIKKDQMKRNENDLIEQSKAANFYIRQTINQDSNNNNANENELYNLNGPELAMQLGIISGMQVILYDANGKVVGNSVPFSPKKNVKNQLRIALQNKIVSVTAGDTLTFFAPLLLFGYPYGVIQFEYPLTDTKSFYKEIEMLFFVIGAITFISSFLFAYLYFNRLTSTIIKLKRAVEKIRQGQFQAISPLKKQDEIGDLSRGIFHMSQQIEQNILPFTCRTNQIESSG
jgi:two-component system phosphate regulon sensor histidine kinase PhoR